MGAGGCEDSYSGARTARGARSHHSPSAEEGAARAAVASAFRATAAWGSLAWRFGPMTSCSRNTTCPVPLGLGWGVTGLSPMMCRPQAPPRPQAKGPGMIPAQPLRTT